MVDSIIRTARAGGAPADDERWSERHIMYLINNYRSEMIYANAFLHNDLIPEIDPQTVQDLGCVTLTNVDVSECEGLPYGCMVKKAANIPKFIDLPDMAAATYVGSINKTDHYAYVPRELIEFRRSLRFAKPTDMWYMIGSNLYVVTSNIDLCYINIAGVFDDPTTACSYTNDGDTCCFDVYADEYPVSRRMGEDIMQAILHNEIAVFLNTVPDEVNDSAGI